jgi:hypothetical protein
MVRITTLYGLRYSFARFFLPRPEWLSRLNFAERTIRQCNYKKSTETKLAPCVDLFRAPFVGSFPMMFDDPHECPADYMPGNCICRPIPSMSLTWSMSSR